MGREDLDLDSESTEQSFESVPLRKISIQVNPSWILTKLWKSGKKSGRTLGNAEPVVTNGQTDRKKIPKIFFEQFHHQPRDYRRGKGRRRRRRRWFPLVFVSAPRQASLERIHRSEDSRKDIICNLCFTFIALKAPDCLSYCY